MHSSALSPDLLTQLQQQLRAPSSPQLGMLARQLHQQGEREAALTAYERWLELNADDLQAWFAVAALRLELGLPQAALAACRHALQLAPEAADAHYNAGMIHSILGQHQAALACYDTALTLEPRHYASLRNRPLALGALGNAIAAREAAASAINFYPADAWLYVNQAELALSHQRALPAEAAFRHALDLDTNLHQARYGLSLALAMQARVEAAYIEYAAALAAAPDLATTYQSPLLLDAHGNTDDLRPERVAVLAGMAELRQCNWSRYTDVVERYARHVEGSAAVPPLDGVEMPYAALLLPLDEALRQQGAQQTARLIAARVEPRALLRLPPRADGKLRIAYLSPDFTTHPTYWLSADLYALHARDRFSVYAYALNPPQATAERARIMRDVDVFREAAYLAPSALAQLIINDRIDILIDLSGYTRHTKPEVMALRPAAVQVSYLGFMGTQGGVHIDYAIVDRQALTSDTRQYWDESIAYLPDCSYICSPVTASLQAPTRESLGLPAQAFVMAALHTPHKLEPGVFDVWLGLLKTLPQAILWLLEERPAQAANLRAYAQARGVDAARLVFAPLTEHEAHLARYQQADIFLDTFVYNGHTTTVDALSMGVPVVTLRGRSVVARVAASMLMAHGMPELIAATVADYTAIVQRLAGDPAWRALIRQRVADDANSRLFCTERRVREIEAAYEQMWARHQAGLPPQDFDVPRAP